MHIQEQHQPAAVTCCRECLTVDQGKDSKREEVLLLSEHLLEIYINDRPAMNLVCVAEDLTELVLGRLLTDGVIEGIRDIESLSLCESEKKSRRLSEKRGYGQEW